MKKERIIEIIILFIVMCIIIAGACAIKHYKFDKPNTYTIIFQDIDSIVKGSPVRFMGINIGHVIKLERKDKFILCKIKITKKGVKIPNATIAKVEFNGLGGSKSIELMPPAADNSGTRGIVAGNSLRINDFVDVVKDLKDVCVIINDFVQNIDPQAVMYDIKEITNPESIDGVNLEVQKILDRRKNAAEKANFISDITAKLEKMVSSFLN